MTASANSRQNKSSAYAGLNFIKAAFCPLEFNAIQRSEIAAFIDRLQHNYSAPDWYQDLERTERLSQFEKVQPNQLSLNLYETLFRDS